MNLLKKIVDKLIYKITQKPNYYVEVKNPPTTIVDKLLRPQDARQVQYNNWSKAHHVYSGSYLPKNANILLQKGWNDETNIIISNNKPTNPSKFYRRKKTNQWVRNELNHWHWYNWWNKQNIPKNFMRGGKGDFVYLDKFGNPCVRNSPESHIKGV